MGELGKTGARSRRQMLAAIAAGGGALVTACGRSPALAAPAPVAPALPAQGAESMPRALAGGHAIVPLPFAPGALNGLSERMIASHHEKNYGGAVRNLNRVESELAQVTPETPPFVVAALRERELTFRNSKTLHEAYFQNLGGDGRRSGAIEGALSQAYGSTARWEQWTRATAMGLGGGSGWVVLYYEVDTGALRTVGSAGHPQALASGVPLLVLDMYEHSYQIDFGASVERYLDAFFANVNWDAVNARLALAQQMNAILRRG
jgi:Fe-Mn family superoxide dismutase